MRIVIFGMPGAGKGTVSLFLMKNYGLSHFSTGDALRNIMEEDTDLGREVAECITKGNLVSDEILKKVVRAFIKDNDKFVLDGYPRNVKQVDHLLDMSSVDLVLYLEVDDDVAVKRLLGRGRTDDTEEVIRNRLKVYRDSTSPVLKHLQERGFPTYSVKSEGTIEEMNAKVKFCVDSLFAYLDF